MRLFWMVWQKNSEVVQEGNYGAVNQNPPQTGGYYIFQFVANTYKNQSTTNIKALKSSKEVFEELGS